MENNIQLFVACTKLLGVGMVAAYKTVAAYWNDTSEVAQGHNFGL